ncbi:XRE family transcriptional regulator [Pseudonocardia sp. GCM10023141]|uniref:XRE family transcriptional regulator n=1 Tax=Pseudonocardia sp. GCM10023141 TaxID=3252653 RepID=UPI003613BD45
MTPTVTISPGARIAVNRERQRELYGAPLGDRVRSLTAALGISQARLARTLGISPAMLSQLVSARRVKIGDPAVLARMLMLDQRCRTVRMPADPHAVEVLLVEVAGARWQWTGGGRPPAQRHSAGSTGRRRPAAESGSRAVPSAADALRGIAAPARLAAAAATLASSFPELAEVLRQAAARPRS